MGLWAATASMAPRFRANTRLKLRDKRERDASRGMRGRTRSPDHKVSRPSAEMLKKATLTLASMTQ